jgi:hypothetical protein
MKPEDAQFQEIASLLNKIVSQYQDDPLKVVFLIGSPLSVPCGVPDVSGMVNLIAEEFQQTPASFIAELKSDGASRYQAAFRELLNQKSMPYTDKVIRKAVLKAHDSIAPRVQNELLSGYRYAIQPPAVALVRVRKPAKQDHPWRQSYKSMQPVVAAVPRFRLRPYTSP